MTLGEVIKRERESNKWSINELAKRAGVSSSTVFRIENGIVDPTFRVLFKISDAFDLDLSSLIMAWEDSNGRTYMGW